MQYITEIDAVEELETLRFTDGILLKGEDCLMRMEEQRLLVQSLLVSPPKRSEDLRLGCLLRSQTVLWLEKIENCANNKIIIRLPDKPVDAFLPGTKAEMERLGEFMAVPFAELYEQIRDMRTMNPDLSCRGCRMMISNELLFRTYLRSLLTAAKQRGVCEVSILLPFIAEKQEVLFLRGIITECAATTEIRCRIGAEIATPRAACIAEELAADADFIIFRFEELVQLLYGMSKHDTKQVISRYMHEKVFQHNPFTEFDEMGMGTLITIAVNRIRQIKPDIVIGAAGRPALTEKGRTFCSDMGINMLLAPQNLFRLENVFKQERKHA